MSTGKWPVVHYEGMFGDGNRATNTCHKTKKPNFLITGNRFNGWK